MATEPSPAQRIAAWRQAGADRVDPVRFHTLVALTTRTAQLHGQTRALLEARLVALAEDYAQILSARAKPATTDARPIDAERGTSLSTLLTQLGTARQPPAKTEIDAEASPNPRPPANSAQASTQRPAAATDSLPALDEFRQLWTRLRTEEQLRQSRQEAPEDAGPLNSGVLVHRAIALMRDAAPGYLGHFLAYLDALAWLEQMQGGGGLPAADTATQAPITGRPPRRKPRKRSG